VSQTLTGSTTEVLGKKPDLRLRLWFAAVCVVALAFGLLVPIAPLKAFLGLAIVPLAFLAPFGSLSVLIALTVLVPFEIQDSFSVIGGRERPGLLVVDLVMVLSLIRLAWLVVRRKLAIDLQLLAGSVTALLCAAALAFGIASGADMSEAGHEARRMVLGVGTFLIAWPLLQARRNRRRLAWLLLAVGVALGLWGLYQWFFSVGFTWSDVGVRPGVDEQSTGRGQLKGGMAAYPVAVILAWSVLISGHVRRDATKCALAAIILLNGVCLAVGYERTMWATTAGACLLLVLAAGPAARRMALRFALLALSVTGVLAVAAPGEARAVIERLMSVLHYSTDDSYLYRMIESRNVIGLITQRPITGSGFGATVTWGAEDQFGTVTTSYAHNGYLWLAWKIGIPAAVLFLVLLGGALFKRSVSAETDYWRAMRRGSQAALLALLLINAMFATFSILGVTALMGLLVAVCYSHADINPENSG
jgi:O-antigen ligase/polysaccharide polymerase Wzy-like membrane protein